MSDGVDEFVDDERGLRVEARVGFVAEQVFRVQGNGTGNGYALLHAARDFAGHLLFGSLQVDAVEAELGAADAVGLVLVGEHVEGEHHIFEHRHGVEEGCRLEDHAHLAAQHHPFALGHLDEVAAVVEYLSLGGLEQAHDVLHEHGLSAAALADDEVGLSILEGEVDVLEHVFVLEGLV